MVDVSKRLSNHTFADANSKKSKDYYDYDSMTICWNPQDSYEVCQSITSLHSQKKKKKITVSMSIFDKSCQIFYLKDIMKRELFVFRKIATIV